MIFNTLLIIYYVFIFKAKLGLIYYLPVLWLIRFNFMPMVIKEPKLNKYTWFFFGNDVLFGKLGESQYPLVRLSLYLSLLIYIRNLGTLYRLNIFAIHLIIIMSVMFVVYYLGAIFNIRMLIPILLIAFCIKFNINSIYILFSCLFIGTYIQSKELERLLNVESKIGKYIPYFNIFFITRKKVIERSLNAKNK